MTSGTVESRYSRVMERVAVAAKRSGRRPEDIFVIAVSKYAEMDEVRELVRLGHRDFGESQAQQLIQRAAMMDELMSRQRTLPGVDAAHREELGLSGADRGAVRWHMIGHLQRNKVKKLIGVARLIHSVDSLRLVEEIQAVAHKRDEVVDVLVQVNCSGETSKFGCAVAAAPHLVEQIETMVHLRARGFMTMAPLSEDPSEISRTFDRCRELYEETRLRGYGADHFNILSMGMTNDFELGIEHGANMVRIGSAIFGERDGADDLHDPEDE